MDLKSWVLSYLGDERCVSCGAWFLFQVLGCILEGYLVGCLVGHLEEVIQYVI
jgi:hypothetical protein